MTNTITINWNDYTFGTTIINETKFYLYYDETLYISKHDIFDVGENEFDETNWDDDTYIFMIDDDMIQKNYTLSDDDFVKLLINSYINEIFKLK